MFLAACLAACSGGIDKTARPPADNELPKGHQGGVQKIGNPYKIAGVWYYPKSDPGYDQTGLASWYGQKFHNKSTANGEIFNMNALTAAHKTLPLPSFVKVTNLKNGRNLILRVNDRGPFVGDRIIDVSRRAAQLLGFDRDGVTKVRIQETDENGKVISRPVKNKRAKTAARKAGNITPSASPDKNINYFVQIGAFSERDRADSIQEQANSFGIQTYLTPIKIGGQDLWRVRIGPYQDFKEASGVFDRLVASGFQNTKILLENK